MGEKEGKKKRKRKRRRKGWGKERSISSRGRGRGLAQKLPLLIILPTTTSIATRSDTLQGQGCPAPGLGREGKLSLKSVLHVPLIGAWLIPPEKDLFLVCR